MKNANFQDTPSLDIRPLHVTIPTYNLLNKK